MDEMYDDEWAARYEDYANASIAGRDGLFNLAHACLSRLPQDARILVVGSGTGSEILQFAQRHPNWRFEAVEPSAPMLAVSQRRIDAAGFGHQVVFHHGIVQGIDIAACDAATSILVAQHVVDDQEARGFFAAIAANLVDRAPLFSADISIPQDKGIGDALLQTWQTQAVSAGLPAQAPASLISRFGRDLKARTPAEIERLLSDAGFSPAVQVFQSTIYRAWTAHRAGS
jgi:tRNA (cmo5U34)-methyltransferase